MAKHIKQLALVLLTTGLISLGGVVSHSQPGGPLVVYTYSSFVSYGLADIVAQAFQQQTGAEVRFVATADSRAMLARLIAERDARGEAPADVFVGVEINDLHIARRNDVFEALSATDVPNSAGVPVEIRFDSENKLIPYEHGFITLVYNSEMLLPEEAPQTFDELLNSHFRDSLIVIDPRTSSPGLSFLLWTISQFGDPGYLDYWRQLEENILTITDSWDVAFDLFSRGEAPIVVSFSTDHAFDLIYNNSQRNQIITLEGEGYRTIFGAGVVRGAKQPELARQFLNVLLSAEIQSQITETEWMIPANPNARARLLWFENVVFPENPVLLPSQEVAENVDRWIEQWVSAVLSN